MVSSNKEIKLLTINDLAACNAPLFHTDHMPAKKQGQSLLNVAQKQTETFGI